MLDRSRVAVLRQIINRDGSFDQRAELFGCIGDPTCLKLISLLATNGQLCVSDLTSILGLSMPAVSHQLKKLRNLGLVTRTRDGRIVCYSLSKNELARAVKKMLRQSSGAMSTMTTLRRMYD